MGESESLSWGLDSQELKSNEARKHAVNLKHQKRLLSTRRRYTFGERYKIITLRFGRVGSKIPTGKYTYR